MAASILKLALAVSALSASAYANGVNITKQDANFDDITILTPGESIQPVPTPYHGLAFNGFQPGTSSAPVDALVASSPPNFAFHSGATQGPANITTKYAGSKSIYYDLQSFAGGCYAPTQNGDAAPPVNCTLTLTGTKYATGQTVTANFFFGTGSPDGISLKTLPVQEFDVPNTFMKLTSVVITANSSVVPNIAGATLQFEIDDYRYTLAQYK